MRGGVLFMRNVTIAMLDLLFIIVPSMRDFCRVLSRLAIVLCLIVCLLVFSNTVCLHCGVGGTGHPFHVNGGKGNLV